MAKIKVAGEAVVLVSDVALKDYQMVEKYRPDALVVKDEEDGKTPVFKIMTSDDSGTVGKYGIIFGRETTGGNASITMIGVAMDGENIKGHISDELGAAIVKLEAVEKNIPSVIEKIKAEKALIESKIEIL